jgi:trehalose utilization protein
MRRFLPFGLLLALSVLNAPSGAQAADPIRVVVWDEQQPKQKEAYENFLGNAIADYLKAQPGLTVRSVNINDPEQGLSKETIDNCDVLIWWGHVRHGEIKREKAKEIVARIKEGKLSLLALHSAHWSRPFIEAMNERSREWAHAELVKTQPRDILFAEVRAPAGNPKTSDPITPSLIVSREKVGNEGVERLIGKLTLPNCCFPTWREDGAPSHVRVLVPDHPLAKGLPAKFDIPHTEMYSSPFHVPKPDVSVFEETWDKGESFQSGSYWKVGKGGVVYFRPGHESYPVYKQAEPLKVVENAVRFLGK